MCQAAVASKLEERMTAAQPATKRSEPQLVTRVRAALARAPGLKEKRMFGGTAFMVRGRICVTARAERIMCRIDPALQAAALKRKGCRSVVMGGREYRGYVYVDAPSLKTKRALDHWVELALNYNDAADSTSRRRLHSKGAKA
jgi:TfoX/Sxy family transcriptional regulator of competence genes